MRSILAATAAAATLLTLTPAAEAAAPSVQITRVYYDSPGKDLRSNKSLNGEWVRIYNRTGKTINLSGWTLRDKTGYRYTFPKVKIKPRKTITIHTGRGKNTTAHLYWGRRAYVWNNDKDTAYLRTRSGKLIDSCSYNSTRHDYKNC